MARSTTSRKELLAHQLAKTVSFAGIDYHKKFSVVTLGDSKGKVLLEGYRLVNDKAQIKRFFASYVGIQCTVESCRGYEWFVDYLKELGLVVHLANPYKAKLLIQSRCKTDKLDSRKLMELLAIGYLPTCYQPSPEERKLRERLRWRAFLVCHCTKMKIKIHVLLDKENQGLAISRLFTTNGREFLSRVPLSESRKLLLNEHVELLGTFEDFVKRQDGWVKKLAKTTPTAVLLTTIPGVGELTALLFIAEVGDVTRFRSSDQIVSYFGMVPGIYSSAERYRTGKLTKQGSSLVRWMLNQAAWIAMQKSPEFGFHYRTVMAKNGKQAAITSTARKLARVMYRVMRDRKIYEPRQVGRLLT